MRGIGDDYGMEDMRIVYARRRPHPTRTGRAASDQSTEEQAAFEEWRQFESARLVTWNLAAASMGGEKTTGAALCTLPRPQQPAQQWYNRDSRLKSRRMAAISRCAGKAHHRIADGYWLQAAYNGYGAGMAVCA